MHGQVYILRKGTDHFSELWRASSRRVVGIVERYLMLRSLDRDGIHAVRLPVPGRHRSANCRLSEPFQAGGAAAIGSPIASKLRPIAAIPLSQPK